MKEAEVSDCKNGIKAEVEVGGEDGYVKMVKKIGRERDGMN